jgi:hypothetical protein
MAKGGDSLPSYLTHRPRAPPMNVKAMVMLFRRRKWGKFGMDEKAAAALGPGGRVGQGGQRALSD